jgi:hypothetical protein
MILIQKEMKHRIAQCCGGFDAYKSNNSILKYITIFDVSRSSIAHFLGRGPSRRDSLLLTPLVTEARY